MQQSQLPAIAEKLFEALETLEAELMGSDRFDGLSAAHPTPDYMQASHDALAAYRDYRQLAQPIVIADPDELRRMSELFREMLVGLWNTRALPKGPQIDEASRLWFLAMQELQMAIDNGYKALKIVEALNQANT